jgi:hypothetical protein
VDSTGDELSISFVDIEDDFNPDSYQTSLSTIISRMSDAIVSGDEKVYGQTTPAGPYSTHLVAPFQYKTVSVEPLHFLGITPTAEKAALLSACKFTFLLA